MRFRAEDERLSGSRTGAPANVAFDEIRRVTVVGARGSHQGCGVAQYGICRGDAANELLERDELARAKYGGKWFAGRARGAAENGDLLLFFRVADANVEQESVELRFGKRIGAFLLDRVLRRQHEEWFR